MHKGEWETSKDKRTRQATEVWKTTDCRGMFAEDLVFMPTAWLSTREAIIRPNKLSKEKVGQRHVTPRQACPLPNGFGRNLRSKTRWFTGFCNSHQVSHFATFFIDARAKISVAESRLDILKTTMHPTCTPFPGQDRGNAHSFNFLGAIHADVLFVRSKGSAAECMNRKDTHTTLAPREKGTRGTRPFTPKH